MSQRKAVTSRSATAIVVAVATTFAWAALGQGVAPTPPQNAEPAQSSPAQTPQDQNRSQAGTSARSAQGAASASDTSGPCAPGGNLSSVLACMDAASAKFRTAQANIELVQYTALLKGMPDATDTQSGQIYFRRRKSETQIALWIQKPHPKQAVVRDNKIIFYDPGTKQLTERDLGSNKQDVEAVMNLGFGSRGEDLAKDYSVTLSGWETLDGVKSARLELIAKSERLRNLFTKLLLWIDPVRDVALQQQRFEKSGDYQLTRYTNIKMSANLPDDKFVIKK